jgi:hypothetical protein
MLEDGLPSLQQSFTHTGVVIRGLPQKRAFTGICVCPVSSSDKQRERRSVDSASPIHSAGSLSSCLLRPESHLSRDFPAISSRLLWAPDRAKRLGITIGESPPVVTLMLLSTTRITCTDINESNDYTPSTTVTPAHLASDV